MIFFADRCFEARVHGSSVWYDRMGDHLVALVLYVIPKYCLKMFGGVVICIFLCLCLSMFNLLCIQVKLKSVQEYLLEKEFGSNYRESRCFPRRFWINLTDTVSPSSVKIPTETHPTTGLFPGTKSDFQILLLFSQVSLADASDSQQDNAFAQFR